MRVKHQAERSGFFDKIHVFTDFDLLSDDVFQDRHGDFVAKNPTGFGFWIWKPYLLAKTLAEAACGDIVFYCDAGCEINPLGRSAFREYCAAVEQAGVLLFRMPSKYASERWTKGDLLSKFPGLVGQGQITGALIAMRADDAGKLFVNSWYSLCCEDNYRFLDDRPSILPDHKNFGGVCRHDQCCLSAAALLYSPYVLPNRPEFAKGRARAEQPIVVNRSKSGRQKIRTLSVLHIGVMLDFTKSSIPKIAAIDTRRAVQL